MSRTAWRVLVLAALVLALMPAVGRAGPQLAAAAPAQISVPEPPSGPFIRVNPAPDKVAVNLPVWLAVDRSWWRPLEAVTDLPAPTTTTSTLPAGAGPPPATATTTTAAPPPSRVTVTMRPLYVDWEPGDGSRFRCFGPGTVYDPALPLSTQTPDCTHTYRQPRGEATIKAAITYGSIAVVEASGQPPRAEVLGSRVFRDELKVRVNELQALDPGVPLSQMFPPGAEGGAPPSSAQVPLPSPDEPDEAREGEYFPDPPSGWERFTNAVGSIGPTILKGAAVIATGIAVAAAVGLICATGVGCVLLAGAAAGIAAGALGGALFCGASLECVGKGALVGGVGGLAFAAAPFLLAGLGITGAGALTVAVVGGGLAGFAGTLTGQLLDGNLDPGSLVVNTLAGMVSAGLLSKLAPGLLSRFRVRRPPPTPPPASRPPPVVPPRGPAIPGDADFVGPLPNNSWTLAKNGMGAHLAERVNVAGRPNLAGLDASDTPRFYPVGSAENAGQAHVRLHQATRAERIKLRGGNPQMSDDELLAAYQRAYSRPELQAIRGELRTPTGKPIGTNLTPREAWSKLMEWLRVPHR